MEISSVRVVIELAASRSAHKLQTNMEESLISYFGKKLNIQGEFRVLLKDIKAEVNFVADLNDKDELCVEFVPIVEEIKEDAASNQNPNIQNSQDPSSIIISVENLKGRRIFGKHLLSELNEEWATPQGFHLVYTEGEKSLAQGRFKRTLGCSTKGCKFKLIFKAESSQEQCNLLESEELIESEELRDNLLFELDSSKNIHNHALKYTPKSRFTPEIIQEIDNLKGKVASFSSLVEIINKNHKTKFDYNQIIYQVKRLSEINYGKPDEDANLFKEIIKEYVNSRGGYYSIEIGEKDTLQKILFVSDQMLNYATKFLDVVLIDATYRRNRFNMPIVNVVGINNYGKTIFLGFAIVNNEKAESYSWVFNNLKKAWKTEPQIFITDEADEIIKGCLFFRSINLIVIGMKLHFKSRNAICG